MKLHENTEQMFVQEKHTLGPNVFMLYFKEMSCTVNLVRA